MTEKNKSYEEYKQNISQMFEYLPPGERSDMISRLVARYPIPLPFVKMKADVVDMSEERKIELRQKLSEISSDFEYISLESSETSIEFKNVNFDRDKLEEALAAVMNCRGMKESIEKFRRHMGVTTYSDPSNQKLLAFASIGHNARVSDFIVDERQQVELNLILQDLKNLLDDMYPDWATLNLELKGPITEEKEKEIHDWVKIGVTQNRLETEYECSNCPAKKIVHQCPPEDDKVCNATNLIWKEVIKGKCV